MLFDDPELRSNFELEYQLSDEDASLHALSKEISRMTMKLYDHYLAKRHVRFHCKGNDGTSIYVDFTNINEQTWFRSIPEIKEILYRSKINGKFQKQFSLNKALEDFNIKEPEDEENYKRYLQLLYVFYMINYFAFPNKNIFKILKREQISYLTAYDEGCEQGIYMSFILSNLLNGAALYTFVLKTDEMASMMNAVSMKLLNLDHGETSQTLIEKTDKMIQEASEQTREKERTDETNDVIQRAIDYFHNYSMYAYSVDLLFNLTSDKELFRFDQLQIGPFEIWKHRYVFLENLDEFLLSDEVFLFCKQSAKKIEVRDKLKFYNSNSVKFAKKLIAYDKEWIQTFQEPEEGLLFEFVQGNMAIYALKIATVIKTYDDLVNKMKIRISSGRNRHLQPLRSILSARWDSDCIFPPTLGIRFFMLAVHAQYLNAIDSKNGYKNFFHRFLLPEILNMKVFCMAYTFNTFEEARLFLYNFLK